MAKLEKLYWAPCFGARVIVFSFFLSFFHTVKILPQTPQNEQTNTQRLVSEPTGAHVAAAEAAATLELGQQKLLRQLTEGMPEWHVKYKTNLPIVLLPHRCAQGLSFHHASHLCWSLKILSASFSPLVYLKWAFHGYCVENLPGRHIL